jgi:hypothetical protein
VRPDGDSVDLMLRAAMVREKGASTHPTVRTFKRGKLIVNVRHPALTVLKMGLTSVDLMTESAD